MPRKSRRIEAPVAKEASATSIATADKNKIMTAAYVRLSVEQEDEDTIQNQAAYINEYIKKHDELEFAGVYMDHGYSGTNFERPEFARLMTDIQSGVIGCIVVKDLSRFGRNYIETGYYLETLLPKLNVRMIAINDNYDSDRKEDRDSIAVPVKNMVNEMYAKDQSRKVSIANERARANGTYTIEHSVYGYTLDHENNNYIINPDTAPVVQMAFRWFLNGMACGEIADRFNKMGIPTPLEYKCMNEFDKEISGKLIWNSDKVRDLFKRDVYAGDLVLGIRRSELYKNKPKERKVPREEWTVYKNHHDAIIPREDVEKVQDMLKGHINDRRKVISRNEKLNSGYNKIFNKLVYCKRCNRVMYQDHKRYENGEYKPVGNTYMCKGRIGEHDRNGCFQSINDDLLRVVVTDQIRNLALHVVDTNDLLQKLKGKQGERYPVMQYQNRIGMLSMKEEQCTGKIGNLYENLSAGLIDKEDYQVLRSQYQSERANLRKQKEEAKRQLEKINASIRSFEELAAMLQQYINGITITRELAEKLIDRIDVDKGKVVEIRFKCRDVFQEVLEILKEGEQT